MASSRSRLVSTLASAAGLAVVLVACAHHGDATSQTSLTSATPPAAREPTRIGDAASRLADEVCKRKASCAQAGPTSTSWRWVSSTDCVERERPRMQTMLQSWRCSEVNADARLEMCLPAIKAASCGPLLANDNRLPLCPRTASCIDDPNVPAAPTAP